MSEHTPGPWRRGQVGNMRVYGPDGMGQGISGAIAQVLRPHDLPLIIAAPQLLEALQRLADKAESVMGDHKAVIVDARAAIAAATGGE